MSGARKIEKRTWFEELERGASVGLHLAQNRITQAESIRLLYERGDYEPVTGDPVGEHFSAPHYFVPGGFQSEVPMVLEWPSEPGPRE